MKALKYNINDQGRYWHIWSVASTSTGLSHWPTSRSKLTSLDDVRVEITLFAADPQKAGKERPRAVGVLAQNYRVLSLPKSGELCKPIWVPIYEVGTGAGESGLVSGMYNLALSISEQISVFLRKALL